MPFLLFGMLPFLLHEKIVLKKIKMFNKGNTALITADSYTGILSNTFYFDSKSKITHRHTTFKKYIN